MTRSVTVIGGGPAGMAAALFAAQAGANVTLLERNEKLGKKLYITGKGRCNVTNIAEEPMRFIPHNPRFLYSAFSLLDAAGLRALLAANGCPTKVERGGRVFPESDRASDVTRALTQAMQRAGVRVVLNQRVSSLQGLLQNGPVILATGGASYPTTGSTGDGYTFAREAGHTIHSPRPSLIPLITRDAWPVSLQGLSLRNVKLCAHLGKRKRFEEIGEMLFTHYGISGPLVLSMSSHILDDDLDQLVISLDMKPGLTLEQLERRIQRDVEAAQRRQIGSILPQLVPSRMGPVIAALSGISPDKPANQITKADRLALASLLKDLRMPISGCRPLAEAIITRGGVDVKEIRPGTMESKLVPGLFFAGEIIDVDAHTGGYNLQIAFSTGALAGLHAAKWNQEDGK